MKTSRACKTIHSPKKFVLRLPSSIHEKIFLTAKQHRRSMNAEIIHHLERMLPFSPAIETQPLSTSDVVPDEDHYLSLWRALPTRKRTALFTLLESLDG